MLVVADKNLPLPTSSSCEYWNCHDCKYRPLIASNGTEPGGQPERRFGRVLKSKVLGRCRGTLVVRQASNQGV